MDRTDPARLVAVVVTHNRLAQLRVTLSRLLEAPRAELQAVVVIDNLSDDGTAAWLEAQDDPRLVVRRSPANLGGAGGFEAGMRLAVARFDPDWLLLMDDDARPQPGALRSFARLDRSGWEALAAAVRAPDGRISDMNRPTRNPFWHPRVFLRTVLGRGREGFHLGESDFARGGVRAVDGASFVGLFLSRAAIRRVGFPDGRLFLYGDDTLYTLGLTRAGGRIGFAPGVRFEHDCSTWRPDGRFRPLWKLYYYHRNQLLIYRMAAGWLFWPVLPVVLLRWLWKLRVHGGERRAALGLLARALADGLAGRTAVDHGAVRALDPATALPPALLPEPPPGRITG